MGKKVLAHDPIYGTTYFDFSHAEDKYAVGTFQDVEPLIERNKKLRNDPEYTKQGMKNDWLHTHEIPTSAIPMIEKKYGVKFWDKNDWKKIKSILNDKDFDFFRVTDKKT